MSSYRSTVDRPDKAKAIYFDNEGHTIDYSAEWAADGNTLTFISRPGPMRFMV